jgi:hypothetical protein
LRRWRNPLLILLVMVCAASLWWARRDGPAPAEPPPARPAPAEARPVATRAPLPPVHLAVLNGTGKAGLARRVSRHLADLGCVVTRIADAPHDTFGTTLLVNRRLPDDRARDLAGRLGDIRLLREWDGRTAEDAVLVLGADHRERGLGRE